MSGKPSAPAEQDRRDRIERICRQAELDTAINELIEMSKREGNDVRRK